MKEEAEMGPAPDPRIQAAMAILGRIRANNNGEFPLTPEYFQLQARAQAVEFATMTSMPLKDPIELYLTAVKDYADSTILLPFQEVRHVVS